jgi:hypothetical protein
MPTYNLRNLKVKPQETKTKDKEKVEFENIDNSTKTSQIYKSREAYKKQVNDENLPIGLKNKNDKNLDNQLDLWYEEPLYGKVDFQGRFIKTNFLDGDLSSVNNTEFELINFVADAANNFFQQYNVERRTIPGSILNNINVVKGYTEEENYNFYFEELYVRFFNEVLNDVKYSNSIKDIEDFINVFYNWFITTNEAATEAGFYRSENYNIYNTGLAFDFYDIQSEEDKKAILNDPRFPIINYVAKINGLRVDPNYPGRLIADINSVQMVKLYASKIFPNEDLEKIPELIYQKYFTPVDYFDSSDIVVLFFLSKIISVYNRFAGKYTYRTTFTVNAPTAQNFKKSFDTNKIKRNLESDDFFLVENPDGSRVLSEYAVRVYVQFRIKEEGLNLKEGEEDYLVRKLTTLLSINGSKKFINATKFSQRLYTQSQAINFLENYLFTKKAKGIDQKRSFVFFFERAKEKLLTFGEDFSSLVEQDEEGNIFSVSPVDISTDFS